MSPKRVLLTRPADDSAAIARQLEPMGIAPVIAPVIAIQPLPVALGDEAADAILVTSAHGIAALTEAERARLHGRPVLAVGAASAASARAAGFKDVRTAGGDAEALRDLARLTLPRRSRLLYLAGRVRKPALARMLDADGHRVVVVETYDAVAVPWGGAIVEDLRADPPFVCLHFSHRSADLTLAEIVRGSLDALLARSMHLCLSPDVAVPLHAAGVIHVSVADEPTTTSLLQALFRRFGQD